MNTSMKILAVDDFATMRRIIKNILNELGFEDISEAENGAEAYKMLTEEDYDFVISDWNMPEMSGLELLKKVRQDEKLSKLPILLVTAEAKKEQIIEAAKSGVNGYVLKPFTKGDLREKIEKIFD